MNTRTIVSLGLSAFVMGGTMVGCAAAGGVASAGDRNAVIAAKGAAADAERAGKALARHDPAAIGFAEGAVALAPRNAAYRMLLGQSYLQSGRFASARGAFGDALQLAPDNGKAALNCALATIATGDWQAARTILNAHAATIAPRDLGLAIALAGDPASGVALLTQVARSPDSDAKVRQNLALSFALAGQWQSARIVASTDMSPADVDRRMQEWAAFAQPASASDQVATLLGVRAIADAGQPVAIALNAPVAIAPAQVVAAAAAPAPAPVAMVASTPASATTPMPVAADKAVADAAPVLAAPSGAAKIAVAPAPRSYKPAPGPFYVQLGAFQSAGVARDAWGRATRRFAGLAARTPTGMTFASKAGSFYRLSVGGFGRNEADALCHAYRSKGGVCFVRKGAGDQTAQWLRRTRVQVAAR